MKPSDQSPLMRRKSSVPHYQTFGGISPPKSRGQPLSDSSNSTNGDVNNEHDDHHNSSPLPMRQMIVLAIIALSEQTALNSISPYLPAMASTFPEVDPSQVGVYVGTIASAFALAQLATNYFWGWLSDRIGRKPVILTGTILTAICFIAFGFCRTLWQAILVQAFMGVVNGNQGVVSTCLGEITDRSNQSKAFTYLPVIYGIGGITGPMIGGLLVMPKNPFNKSKDNPYPYLPPNLLAAAILVADFVIIAIFLEESLEEAQYLPPLGKRVKSFFAWFWQFQGSTRPTYTRGSLSDRRRSRSSDTEDDDSEENNQNSNSMPNFIAGDTEALKKKDVLNRDTILLLVTYLIFQLSNVSFNSLYPVFASSKPPSGRDLSPQEIGLSLSFAGVVTILFQVGIFGRLRDKMGNRWAYRAGLGLFVLAFLMVPWVGYKGDKNYGSISTGPVWLWIELGFVLLIKTIATVGGLTSALLLVCPLHVHLSKEATNKPQITNSAPNHAVLGALNGLAQTLSAAGRAVGPFISGALFSASVHVRPKGEALAFGAFGGVAFIGFLLSFGIRSSDLEAEGWDSDSDNSSDKSEDEEEQ